MATEKAKLGAKVRTLRRQAGITQAKLAQQLSISPSYLNLIENNRRPLTAPLLIKLAGIFTLDLQSFAPDEDAQTISALRTALQDPVLAQEPLTDADLQDFVQNNPSAARAMLTLDRAWTSQDASPNHTHAPRDPLHTHHGYFPTLERAAEEFWHTDNPQPIDLQYKLSKKLNQNYKVTLHTFPHRTGLQTLQRFDLDTRTLMLSSLLTEHQRAAAMAHQLALLSLSTEMDSILQTLPKTTPAAHTLATRKLAQAFARAVLLPYQRTLHTAREFRYDLDALCIRLQVPMLTLCRRLVSLRKPGDSGLPFAMIRTNAAGHILEQRGDNLLLEPGPGDPCNLWGVFQSLTTPHTTLQREALPSGESFVTLSRALPRLHLDQTQSTTTQSLSIICPVDVVESWANADRAPSHTIPVGQSCLRCTHHACLARSAATPEHNPRADLVGIGVQVEADELLV